MNYIIQSNSIKRKNIATWRLFNDKGQENIPFFDYNQLIIAHFHYYNKKKSIRIVKNFIDYVESYMIANKKQNDLIYSYYNQLYKKEIQYIETYQNNIKNKQQYLDNTINKKLTVIDSFLSYCFLVYYQGNQSTIDSIASGQLFQQLNLKTFIKTYINHVSLETEQQYAFWAHIKKQLILKNYIEEEHILRNFSLNDISQKPISFPVLGLPYFLKHCYYYRDLMIYAFMAGTGYKASNTLLLKTHQIDFYNQAIYKEHNSQKEKAFKKDGNKVNKNNSHIENILFYDVGRLKKPLKNILTYDLNKLGQHIPKILNYDLAELKNPLIDVLFSDIETIWQSKMNKEEKINMTQDLIEKEMSKRNLKNNSSGKQNTKNKQKRNSKQDNQEQKKQKQENKIREEQINNILKEYGEYFEEQVTEVEGKTLDIEQETNHIENDYLDYQSDSKEEITFIPHLKQIFFYALEMYYKEEYIAEQNHDYVFQFLTNEQKGQPYFQISRQGFKKTFYRNLIRSKMYNPFMEQLLTPYSLRYYHMHYIKNYCPENENYKKINKKFLIDENTDINNQKEYIDDNIAIQNQQELLELEQEIYNNLFYKKPILLTDEQKKSNNN